jgi:hypothetical protein
MDRRVSYEPSLPFQWVCYPYAWLGAFPGFRERTDSPVIFCSCQRQAILNRLALWPPGIHGCQLIRTGFALPDTEDFPWDFWNPILESGAKSDSDFAAALQFRDALCHECRRRIPPTDALAAPSTVAFSTLLRAYTRKKSFELGVDMNEGLILEDRCVPEIREVVPYDPLMYRRSDAPWEHHWDHLLKRHERWSKIKRRVSDLVRGQTREAFGFPRRRPALTSETILYLRTASAFPNTSVQRHHRPKGFRGLSLDIFIPELGIGIEYQGDQHFVPFDHLGGETALLKTQERDARKKDAFRTLGIEILYFEGNVTFIAEGERTQKPEIRTSACNTTAPSAPRLMCDVLPGDSLP